MAKFRDINVLQTLATVNASTAPHTDRLDARRPKNPGNFTPGTYLRPPAGAIFPGL
jgi:hypothetical protein